VEEDGTGVNGRLASRQGGGRNFMGTIVAPLMEIILANPFITKPTGHITRFGVGFSQPILFPFH